MNMKFWDTLIFLILKQQLPKNGKQILRLGILP